MFKNDLWTEKYLHRDINSTTWGIERKRRNDSINENETEKKSENLYETFDYLTFNSVKTMIV